MKWSKENWKCGHSDIPLNTGFHLIQCDQRFVDWLIAGNGQHWLRLHQVCDGWMLKGGVLGGNLMVLWRVTNSFKVTPQTYWVFEGISRATFKEESKDQYYTWQRFVRFSKEK